MFVSCREQSLHTFCGRKRESIVVATVVVANVRTVKMQKSESKEKIRKATSLEVAFLSIYCETAHKIYKNGLFV